MKPNTTLTQSTVMQLRDLPEMSGQDSSDKLARKSQSGVNLQKQHSSDTKSLYDLLNFKQDN